MTTTELIDILKSIEKGASGRSRTISFTIQNKNGTRYIPEPEIKLDGTGDGTLGAECSFLITPTR